MEKALPALFVALLLVRFNLSAPIGDPIPCQIAFGAVPSNAMSITCTYIGFPSLMRARRATHGSAATPVSGHSTSSYGGAGASELAT